MFFLSKEYFCRAHWQHVAVTDIHRTASVESDIVEADVGSVNGGIV
jgi:hypothetical protein